MSRRSLTKILLLLVTSGPAVGTYSDEYEAYLASTGEEIVTVTVDYEIYDTRTGEYYSHGGFPAVVWPMKGYDYLNGGESPFDESYGAYTFMVDEDGKGSFEFKMPKSLYEKTLRATSILMLVADSTLPVRR